MRHYLNVCDINGATVAPVDIITFGSPCQDLSVAGKRAGLKHEGKGDEETTRSGLFMEAVRIIREMRGATNGKYPRFALWENVPGAFSSNGGEDFRIVLEEIAKIADETVSVPVPPKGKWTTAGYMDGDGWSLAWRTVDAQYHGVPQRRRRILLVADFAGQCAGKISFKCEGLRGYPPKGVEEGKSAPADAAGGPGGDDPRRSVAFRKTKHPRSAEEPQGWEQTEIHDTLNVFDTSETRTPVLAVVPVGLEMQAFGKYSESGLASSHKARDYKDATDLIVCGVDCRNLRDTEEVFGTLQAKPNGGKSLNYSGAVRTHRIVRRLTPTECARLQGFPDWWGHVSKKDDMTDEEVTFWNDVYTTHRRVVNGKEVKPKTKEQLLTWYNKLWTDRAEYKMWGNGVALPCVRVPIHNMAKLGARTLASLFDGSGGFPLAGVLEGIEPVWCSEIEPYPIAVTVERFPEATDDDLDRILEDAGI